MASLNKAKDTVRALAQEIQLRTTQEVAEELTRQLGVRREAEIRAAVAQILAETPDLTVEDGSQLVAWQEAREQRRGTPLPEPGAVPGTQ